MAGPYGIISPEEYPECLRGRPELVGLFTGGCVARGVGSSFRARAHAHIEGPHQGWICVRSPKRLAEKMLMLHELAHLIVREGHTDRWRACLRALGGRVRAHERKRTRKPCACGEHRFGNDGATWFVADNRWHSWARCA